MQAKHYLTVSACSLAAGLVGILLCGCREDSARVKQPREFTVHELEEVLAEGTSMESVVSSLGPAGLTTIIDSSHMKCLFRIPIRSPRPMDGISIGGVDVRASNGQVADWRFFFVSAEGDREKVTPTGTTRGPLQRVNIEARELEGDADRTVEFHGVLLQIVRFSNGESTAVIEMRGKGIERWHTYCETHEGRTACVSSDGIELWQGVIRTNMAENLVEFHCRGIPKARDE